MSNSPVITIDGPSGSGKGTIAFRLSKTLGWPILDSGAIYRVLGFAAHRSNLTPDQTEEITELARNLPLEFKTDDASNEVIAYLNDEPVGDLIRTDEAGQRASQVASIPEVREALLQKQRDFNRAPGLIADGRDMGTIVFPEAEAKVFLTASAETRASRRYNQLKQKGIDANLAAILESIKARDERDRTRTVAPLVPAGGAFVVDSSSLSADEVFSQVLDYVTEKLQESS
ncbi:(d)CMP kinase [Pleionea sediminis]|uniref:(d)CMP kinase n=1 Tax=Pleionea sediminis TaxID=2569479 RepID=UPI0011865D0A|nr:(d)CMP kinase [Pleionea sediminis]